MARRPTVSIVGCGRAGGSIALALKRTGYEVAAAWCKTRGGRQRTQRLLNVPVLPSIADVAGSGDVVFVAVPDDAIADVVDEVAAGIRAGKVAVHTSGRVSVDALAPVEKADARAASVHPLQTLPDPTRGADALDGAGVAVTCDPRDRPLLVRLARAWGGRPFTLSDEDKTLYHAAAVFASNYVATSVWSALRLFERLGIPNARQLLAPLTQSAVGNITTMAPEKAMTGPVSRGDTETVLEHIQALAHSDPTGGRITDAYKTLARLTAALARVDLAAFEKVTA